MTFQQAMAATSRELNARATVTCVDAFVISNTPVTSFSVEEGGQVTLGSVTSSRYTLSLPNGGGEWLKNGSILGNRSLTGARVQIQIGVYHDSAWDWQNAGLFIVEKTSAPEYGTAIKLIGNDPIISLDRAYDDQLAYRSTTTLGDILTHVKSKGVTITGSLACNASAIVNFQPDWGEEPTIRDVLGYVLQLGGSLARCDRAGNITIAPTNGSTTHAITTDKYTEFTDDERYFNFNRIKILPNGAKKDAAYVESYVTSAAESAANTLCLESNPLFRTKTTTSYSSLSAAEEAAGLKNRKYYVKVGNKYQVVEEPVETSMTLYYKANKSYNTTALQTMAAGLKTALTGMSFRAITFKWRGDPTVLVGDKVTLTDTRGVSVTTVILQQSMRYEGGFSAEISCPIDLTAVTPATLTSSGAWTPPYFGTGTIDGSVIMPESITGDLVVAGGITADKIASKTVTADEIAAKTITADEIKAGTITADEVAAKTITADEIAAGTITATEIGASQITATHIGTNEIVANTANIKDGVITNAKIANGTIENAKIKDATIETAKIKDAAITTAKIDDAQVTNAKIANATIETAKIKDAAITTAKIQDAQITNAKIASAGIDYANIKDVNAGTAIFRTGVGDDIYLDRLVVNSANIGTATIGELMVRDAQGKLHKVLIGTNGVVSSEEVKVDGQNLSNDAMMQVSQRLVWRQATQPSAPFIGMIWMDTSLTPAGKPKEILRRCTAIAPSVVWEVVQSNELHTNVIDVDDNGMNILSGGNLNLLSGGAINIKNLSGTDNVINMDNTGLTLSSTGKLKITSSDAIEIGGYPMAVGGVNLLQNSGDFTSTTGWTVQYGSGGETLTFGPSSHVNRNVLVVGNITQGFRLYTPTSNAKIIAGQQYTISFVSSYNTPNEGSIIDNDASTTINTFTYVDEGVIANAYRLYTARFTASASAQNIKIRISFDYAGYASSYLSTIQLEKGPMATDWSPSPQDTVDALDALDGRLGTAETSLTGKTKIWYQAAIPVSTSIGDVWYKTDATPSIIVYRAESVGAEAIASGEWVDITDSTLSKALTGLDILGDGVVQVFEGAALPTAADVMVGDMWLYTGTDTTTKKNGSMYRAVVTGADDLSEWTAFTAGAVITPYISLSANELHIDGAASLVVENSTNGNGITMNSTGMTIASGSKLAISATDLMISGETVETYASEKIRLAVSGGVNLLQNSGDFTSTTGWTVQYGSGGETLTFGPSSHVKRNVLVVGNITQGFRLYTPTSNAKIIAGQQYTISFVSAYNTPNAGSIIDNDASTTINTFTYVDEGVIANAYRLYTARFTASASAQNIKIRISFDYAGYASTYLSTIQLEKGTAATDWSPSSADPASGVKTSYIDIATDHIDISTGGNLSLTGGNFNLTGGSGAKAIGMSTNRADEYMMWAGNASPLDAPFSVKRDGSVKATKIQQEYSQSFWDMADYGTNGNGVNPFPAEFDFYIPSGYSVDFFELSFKVGKARTFAKAAGTPSKTYTSIPDTDYSAGPTNWGTPDSHYHGLNAHKHTLNSHTHGIDYGINEKSTLATASTLKINGSLIYTTWWFEPDMTSEEEVLPWFIPLVGWNKITIQPNNDARISCYLRIGLTPS